MSGYLAHLVSRTFGLGAQVAPARRNPFETPAVTAMTDEGGQLLPADPGLTTESSMPSGVRESVTAGVRPGVRPESAPSSAPATPHAEMALRFDAVMAMPSHRAPRDENPAREIAAGKPPPADVGSVDAAARVDGSAGSPRYGVVELNLEPGSPTKPSQPGPPSHAIRDVEERQATPMLAPRARVPGSNANEDIKSALRSTVAPASLNSAQARGSREALVAKQSTRLEAAAPHDAVPTTTMVLTPSAVVMPRADGRDAADSQPRTPDVHITIGRVEIRAQQPVARPQPVAKAVRAMRPTLNLDSYLQQRRGERK